MPSQANAWLRAQAERHRQRRATTQAWHDAGIVRRARDRREFVELVPRPAPRMDPDTAPMTLNLPVRREERWTALQVTFAALSWLLIGAMCLLLVAGVGLLIGSFVVLALVLLATWVSPPYVVAGLLVLACLYYVYRYERGGES